MGETVKGVAALYVASDRVQPLQRSRDTHVSAFPVLWYRGAEETGEECVVSREARYGQMEIFRPAELAGTGHDRTAELCQQLR